MAYAKGPGGNPGGPAKKSGKTVTQKGTNYGKKTTTKITYDANGRPVIGSSTFGGKRSNEVIIGRNRISRPGIIGPKSMTMTPASAAYYKVNPKKNEQKAPNLPKKADLKPITRRGGK